MSQRPISLNPTGLEAFKVTHPPVRAKQPAFKIEPMRFIPHSGWAA